MIKGLTTREVKCTPWEWNLIKSPQYIWSYLKSFEFSWSHLNSSEDTSIILKSVNILIFQMSLEFTWSYLNLLEITWNYTCASFTHCGTPRVSSHLTLDFVVPCPLSLPRLQTKDIFGQTRAGWRSRISSVTHLCSLTNMYHGTPS